MAAAEQPPSPADTAQSPSFPAAAAALEALRERLDEAAQAPGSPAEPTGDGPEAALAALLCLRQIRERLAGWESGLIETARDSGASWADLAGPLGVASRQAAERRYLRLRPGAAGSTGEQRVQATRSSRAANRSVASWARDNAADLRRLAGQVTSLNGLPAGAATSMHDLNQALAADDASRLVGPLAATRAHLRAEDSEIADRIDAVTRHTDRLRQDTHDQRST
ncbi:HSP18 transcriptional regulator [Streptomyces sp. CJ_13]|uniref:HSP18 transcriptional regulator n=1 Tax=Streptomyces sp. CJ_13 TaxID=2724943 RepID=UPI001BDBDDB2|nr:HSP18 transcriptional regulator [Streptomyces sp. CJ_13]MBT1186519.1 HSP18 transcriptional regulator [Streptomyces sp. CJ_13]